MTYPRRKFYDPLVFTTVKHNIIEFPYYPPIAAQIEVDLHDLEQLFLDWLHHQAPSGRDSQITGIWQGRRGDSETLAEWLCAHCLPETRRMEQIMDAV